MYDINLELEQPAQQQQGHFDTPLVEHYQTRTAHNLSGHVDNAFDQYYHHDAVQDDRPGGEVHTFHESLAVFFPDGQDRFDVPLNLQYEGDSGANVWFPMEDGQNWLHPRQRRVEQVTTMGEPEERVHYHTEAVTEVVPVSLHARLGSDTPRTSYTVNRNTREVTANHFDTPLI